MGNTVTKNQFMKSLNGNHGVVDLNDMSEDLKTALKDNNVSEADLKKIAGPDGHIKGAKEYRELYKAVDSFDDNKKDSSFKSAEKGEDGKLITTKSGKLYEALQKEVKENRLQAQYAQPGTKKAEAQPRLTIDKNALVVDEKDRKTAVELKMKGVNQFDLYPDDPEKGGKACFEAAVKQCTDFNKDEHGVKAPKLNGPEDSIQIAYQEDRKGRLKADPTQAKIAREYIDKYLDKGLPVLVGASYEDNNYNKDKMTDHFSTIYKRDYDEKGRLYYEFKDPGNGGKTDKLYVDQDTGKLFKEGSNPKGQYVKYLDYEITQVRTYQGID